MKKLLNRLHPISRLERKRLTQFTKGNLPEPLLALLSSPFPDVETELHKLSFLVLDIETTGLDPNTDRILSIGHLEINDMRVDISTSVHTYIQAEKYVTAEAAVINHIVPEMLSSGTPFDKAMDDLLDAIKGKILIVHGAMVEKSFLDTYLKRRFGVPPLPLIWLDTLLIEKSLLRNKGEIIGGDFQLASVRERYKLPPYLAHNALSDAIATGELFLVLSKVIYGKSVPRLKGMYKHIH